MTRLQDQKSPLRGSSTGERLAGDDPVWLAAGSTPAPATVRAATTSPTLIQFLHASRPSVRGASIMRSYVTAPGFTSMYLRRWKRSLGGTIYHDVLDLADVTAEKPGSGAFTNLVECLHGPAHPGLTLHAERVLNSRFAARLAKTGWTRLDDGSGVPSYFLPAAT